MLWTLVISSPLCSQICWYSSWWFSSWDLCWTSHPLSKGLHHINLWKLSLGSSVCRLCSKSPLPAHYGLLPFRDFVSITNWKQTFSDIFCYSANRNFKASSWFSSAFHRNGVGWGGVGVLLISYICVTVLKAWQKEGSVCTLRDSVSRQKGR